MFETIQPAPADPILGLSEAFRSDPNPAKINLSVGVYKDAAGRTPRLDCVREAELQLAESLAGKAYLPITGDPEYGQVVQGLLCTGCPEVVESKRAVTAHTPGGTGALRVAADFLHANLPTATVWLSSPTWPNHPNIFAAAGVATQSYPYYDKESRGLDLDGMLATIDQMAPGDVILLHGCCHNPTGVDPQAAQWQQIAERVRSRGVLPLVDFAYQGFAQGVEDDTAGLTTLLQDGGELLVCSSFSKNFGLYCERVGALTLVAADTDAATAAQSQVKRAIRSNYSNPPAHGAAIVSTILLDEDLTRQWHTELAGMRDRINGMREALATQLTASGVPGDWSFIGRQNGMFSFLEISETDVDELRARHSVYAVRSGRINVAGLTEENLDRFCAAMKDVLAG